MSQRNSVSHKFASKQAPRLHRAVVEALEARQLLTGSPYHDRGWVSVIVDNTLAAALAPKLDRWKQTLVGDGMMIAPDVVGVLSHDAAPRMNDELYVWKNTAPAQPVTLATAVEGALDQYKLDLQDIKDIINADFAAADAAGSFLSHVILVGHPTVPYSGGPGVNGDYNQHYLSAATSDSYFADFDGTPATWGDNLNLVSSGGTSLQYEFTTNEGDPLQQNDGDGRFDTAFVPGNAIQVTVTGSGSFQFDYTAVNALDEEDAHELQSDTLPSGASAEDVRAALNDMLSPLPSAFATLRPTLRATEGQKINARLEWI
ncbi:MAG: hypothetical protein H7Z14_13275 [Anaerolineae bacterium]|nr:hypothetical protein [Phycisphaerae bacterium]